MIATKHLLKLPVRNGIISKGDVEKLHGEAQLKLRGIVERGAVGPEEGANGARTIGYF